LPDRCRTCGAPISGSYYRVSGAITCAGCAEKAATLSPQDTHAAFVRAVVFGIGASILGLILYSAVSILTGLQIGYMSLAVGYLVGKAMMKGSQGLGGRRYQIVAVALTYAAVSLSFVPLVISEAAKNPKSQQTTQAAPAGNADSGPKLPEQKKASPMGALVAFGVLFLLGLVSPFLELASPVSGLIGLVILYVGIQIAWKTTAGSKIPIMGPFNA
jgi:hypothetical protein